MMQALANAITRNNPECHLMVVLVDERPEEVTDMQRSVKGEVIAPTFDRPPSDHTKYSLPHPVPSHPRWIRPRAVPPAAQAPSKGAPHVSHVGRDDSRWLLCSRRGALTACQPAEVYCGNKLATIVGSTGAMMCSTAPTATT